MVMGSQEIELRQDSAMVLRAQVANCRKLSQGAQEIYKNKKASLDTLRIKLDSALARIDMLKNGRGAFLGSVGSLNIYEFWLELPGYSGPIHGAAAQLTEHGSLQHVSNVSSKSKSGVGLGVVGLLTFGPIGAVAGVLATRKNEVSTQVRAVDNRQLEFQVNGPGYAWSAIEGFGSRDRLRAARDLIISRGSNKESVEVLNRQQSEIVAELREHAAGLNSQLEMAEIIAVKMKIALDDAWVKYVNVRLPLHLELKFKWDCLSKNIKILMFLIGPLLLIAIGGCLAYSIWGGGDRVRMWVNFVCTFYFAAWGGAAVYFFINHRS